MKNGVIPATILMPLYGTASAILVPGAQGVQLQQIPAAMGHSSEGMCECEGRDKRCVWTFRLEDSLVSSYMNLNCTSSELTATDSHHKMATLHTGEATLSESNNYKIIKCEQTEV